MNVLNFITTMLSDNSKIKSTIFAIVIAFVVYDSYYMKQELHAAATEYSFNMVSFGLRGHASHESAIAKIQSWVDNKNEARVAAVQTLCEFEPNRLLDIVERPTALAICRIAA